MLFSEIAKSIKIRPTGLNNGPEVNNTVLKKDSPLFFLQKFNAICIESMGKPR